MYAGLGGVEAIIEFSRDMVLFLLCTRAQSVVQVKPRRQPTMKVAFITCLLFVQSLVLKDMTPGMLKRYKFGMRNYYLIPDTENNVIQLCDQLKLNRGNG